jgi:hypothetical protein
MFWDANRVKFLFETQKKACKNLHWYATNYNPIKIKIGTPCTTMDVVMIIFASYQLYLRPPLKIMAWILWFWFKYYNWICSWHNKYITTKCGCNLLVPIH